MSHKTVKDFDPITDIDILSNIDLWIQRADQPRPEWNGMNMCPYAHDTKPNLHIVKLPYPEVFTLDRKFVMILFVAPNDISWNDLAEYCDQLKLKNPNLIFLTDHHSNPTFMGGLQTNNGKYNVILCHPDTSGINARKRLQKIDYYQWYLAGEFNNVLKARRELK